MVLRSVPAVLAMLALAAHFFRGGHYVATVVCLVASVLFFVRRPLAVVASRVLLLAGCGVWIVTALRLVQERNAFGRPYVRMVLILGGVAAFTALASLVLPGADRGARDVPPGDLR